MNVSARLEGYSPSHDELPPSPLLARYSRKQPLLDIPLTHVTESFRSPTRAMMIQATPVKLSKEHNTRCDNSDMKSIMAIGTTYVMQKQEVNENDNSLQGRIADDTVYKTLGWEDDDNLA
jgi:hypothetical protein